MKPLKIIFAMSAKTRSTSTIAKARIMTNCNYSPSLIRRRGRRNSCKKPLKFWSSVCKATIRRLRNVMRIYVVPFKKARHVWLPNSRSQRLQRLRCASSATHTTKSLKSCRAGVSNRLNLAYYVTSWTRRSTFSYNNNNSNSSRCPASNNSRDKRQIPQRKQWTRTRRGCRPLLAVQTAAAASNSCSK